MSLFRRNPAKDSGIPVSENEIDESDGRREVTITRLRTAILQDKFTALGASVEKSGTDPYNSGVHRALGSKSNPWDKRSR